MQSPHHADCDLRVRRVIKVMSDLSLNADVYWDAKYPGHQKRKNSHQDSIREHYTENSRMSFLRSVIGLKTFHADIVKSILQADLVYINASGIEGLLYIKEVRRYNKKCKIIFDYHDSLPYELFYQLQKLKLASLFKLCWPIYRFYLRHYARYVDAIVGISRTQVEDFKKLQLKEVNDAVVPNFRTFEKLSDTPRVVNDTDEVSLVWLGQVMKGRDLEQVADWVSSLDEKYNFHVFGKIINPEAESSVKASLGDRVRFYGEFKGEKSILESLSGKVIGVFLGWNDPQDTGINSHASPNKYFTYINMQLPVIICKQLKELAEHVENHKAGESVSDKMEFSKAVNTIGSNYSEYCAGAESLKEYYSKTTPEDTIRDFLVKLV